MTMRAKLPLFGLMALVLALSYAAKGEGKQCNSSCGNISISYPFRIKGDPHKCGEFRYELACEYDRTILYVQSVRFYVQEISYVNQRMRVVDASLNPDKCSIPRKSVKWEWSCKFPYDLVYDYYNNYDDTYYYRYRSIYYLNCTTPVNSPLYVDASPCNNSSSSPHKYFYALYGAKSLLDFHQKCTVEVQVRAPFSKINSPSIFDIYKQLLMGFELSWEMYNIPCKLSLPERFLNYLFFIIGSLYELLLWKSWYDKDKNYYGKDEVAFIGFTGFILVRTILGIFCLIAIIVYKFRRRHLSMDHVIEEFLQSQKNLMPIRYSYSDIKRMTNDFKNKIGEGGFGCVFKGQLRSGHLVAIKLLSKSNANGQDFINEVATIGRIHHVNVVRLTGFCVEGSKQALVYEFMPNGSLDKFIFSHVENNIRLSWEKLYEIALGVARGIEYLHRGCEMQILHFDIKPHNILLDENFNPKVSDFGLAKLYSIEDNIVSLTAARGTLGYIAPELFYKSIGGISDKADVYSFGMLLLEMMGRRKNINTVAKQSSQIYFPSWIYERFARGEDMELVDATEGEEKIVRKMIIVAFWCIQMKPINRPSMRKVLEMLEREVELQEIPPRPFVCQYDFSEESTISLNAENEIIPNLL